MPVSWGLGPNCRPFRMEDPQKGLQTPRGLSVQAMGPAQPRAHVDRWPPSSQSSSRSSYYGPWGRSGAWASRRSSWSSLKHKPPSAEHESLLSAERSVAQAGGEGPRDEGPPRAMPPQVLHAHHAHHGPHRVHRHRHHRRTLSLDTRDSVDLAELGPASAMGAHHHRAAWRAGVPPGGPGHEDCNGKMPNLAKDVFTKMGDRHDRRDDEEIDYVSERPGDVGGHGWSRSRESQGWRHIWGHVQGQS